VLEWLHVQRPDPAEVLRVYALERARRAAIPSHVIRDRIQASWTGAAEDRWAEILGLVRGVEPVAVEIVAIRYTGIAWISCGCGGRRACPSCNGAGRVPERHLLDDEGAVRGLTDREIARLLDPRLTATAVRLLTRAAVAIVGDNILARIGRSP
jgi:hypothetical protein